MAKSTSTFNDFEFYTKKEYNYCYNNTNLNHIKNCIKFGNTNFKILFNDGEIYMEVLNGGYYDNTVIIEIYHKLRHKSFYRVMCKDGHLEFNKNSIIKSNIGFTGGIIKDHWFTVASLMIKNKSINDILDEYGIDIEYYRNILMRYLGLPETNYSEEFRDKKSELC